LLIIGKFRRIFGALQDVLQEALAQFIVEKLR